LAVVDRQRRLARGPHFSGLRQAAYAPWWLMFVPQQAISR
jgi:hypothetical protein